MLITSRDRLVGLVAGEGARLLPLGVLDRDEARDLLVHVLGPDRVQAEPDAADELVHLCARLPLALRITAANLSSRPRGAVSPIRSPFFAV